ncbi:MAG: TIM barrel protein [Anaerolineae bacterium]
MPAPPPTLDHLALSTMWMQHRFQRVADFAAAALALGFGGIEVSHIVTPAMLGNADPASLRIRSVHFPAPTVPSPFGLPAEALLSATDETQRGWAVAQGYASIDFALAAGASAVCLHLGETPATHWLEWALAQRFLGGQRREPVYAAALAEVMADRARAAGPALDAARRSLAELASYAAPRGVRLGIESRVQHWQIPTLAELSLLLAENDPAVVGFWYDCGHVQVLHNLGFHRHQDWLAAFAGRIVGVHLHDTAGLRDHLLPGLGELDFDGILAALPGQATLTCELDWYYRAEEIVAGAMRHLASRSKLW